MIGGLATQGVQQGGAVDGLFRINRLLAATLGTDVLAPTTSTQPGATTRLSLYGVHAAARIGVALRHGQIQLDAGAGLLLPRAESRRAGETADRLDVSPSIGVGLGYELPLGQRLYLRARAGIEALFRRPRYVVDGIETLSLRVVAPRATLGLGFRLP